MKIMAQNFITWMILSFQCWTMSMSLTAIIIIPMMMITFVSNFRYFTQKEFLEDRGILTFLHILLYVTACIIYFDKMPVNDGNMMMTLIPIIIMLSNYSFLHEYEFKYIEVLKNWKNKKHFMNKLQYKLEFGEY